MLFTEKAEWDNENGSRVRRNETGNIVQRAGGPN